MYINVLNMPIISPYITNIFRLDYIPIILHNLCWWNCVPTPVAFIFPPLMVKSVKSLFIQLLFFPSNHIESTGPKEQASLHHFFDEGHDAFGDYTNICYQYLLKKNITVGGFPTKITRCSHDFNFHDHSKPLLASWRLSGIASRRNLIHRHMGNAHGWK